MDINNSVEMSDEVFASVNSPISVANILLNIFFVFCMIFPQQGTERMKQPLKALLGSLVGCNSTVHITILFMVFNNMFLITLGSHIMRWYIPSIVIYIMMVSVNSSHCLNVFYCLQIIPVRRLYFIWLKKNIRLFIYCALTVNIAICLLGLSVDVAVLSAFSSDNMTGLAALRTSTEAAFWIRLSLYFFSSCVMLGSSCVTVFFLLRHMKNMKNSRGSCFSSRCQRQIRVTIISITVQALLNITCSTLVITDELMLCVIILNFDMDMNVLCTVISLCSFGTTVNMGLSQSVFRQQAVHVSQKCFRPYSRKIPKNS